MFAPVSPLIHRNHGKAFFPEVLPWKTSLKWHYDHTVVENMWALFLLEDGGSKRFAWLEGRSVLMKEAQGNVKSQKNTFRALLGLPRVRGADCSRILGGSTQEGKDGMVRTWLASKPTTGATSCGGSAQDGTDSMVETWLASKSTTRATFRSESLPCTSY